MTSPKNAQTSRATGKRFYSWRDEAYWSVTTLIAGGIPKPNLLPWGIKSVAEGAIKRRDTFQSMLKPCQTQETCEQGDFCATCDETIRWLKSLPYITRDRAADLGSNVHAAIEAHRLGKPMPPWPLGIKPYMVSFERFLTDFNPGYEMAEASVYSRTQRYAGTLDAIVNLTLPLHTERGRFILDAKSGKGVYPEVGLQLAAYRYAEFVGLPDGSEAPMPVVDGALALHLTPAGYRLIEVRADETVFSYFLYAREVFRFGEEISKTILGSEYGAQSQMALQAV